MNEKIEEDMKAKAAHEYRLKQARQLLKLLGYVPDQAGRYWKEEDLVAQKKKFYRIARPCPIDSQSHDFHPAFTFLNEAQRFEIGAGPQDLCCKKCLGLLQDYMTVVIEQ